MEAEDVQSLSGWICLGNRLSINDPIFRNLYMWEGFDLSSNVYLLKTEEGVLVIDPGNDYTAFYDLFFRSSLAKPQDIKKILLTHGHSEHVVGLFELLRGYPSLRFGESPLEVYIHEACPETFKELAHKLGCSLNFVENGAEIRIDSFSFSVIHTPGHTMDSVCYLHEETKSLFSGDTVIPYAVASPDPVGGGRIDFHLLSMRTLRSRNIQNLFPGHGDPVKGEASLILDGTYGGVIKKIVGLQCPWLEGAQILIGKGYLDEAVFCCDKVLVEDSDNVTALYFKACCLNDMARFNEALAVLDKMKSFNNSAEANPLFLVAQGCSLMGLGNYSEALNNFDRALEVSPSMENALIYKGLALYLSNRAEEAMDIEVFRNAFVGRLKEELLKSYR